MSEINKLATQLHNHYSPNWSFEETVEFVWQLKLNNLSDEEINYWFEKTIPVKSQNQNTKEVDDSIVIEYIPDKYVRDDWR